MTAPQHDHILQLIAHNAAVQGEQTAVDCIEDVSGTPRPVTWSQLWQEAWQVRSNLLREGLLPGSRVLLVLPTGPTYLAAIFGAWWAGVVPSTLAMFSNVRSGEAFEDEWCNLVESFAPAAVITDLSLPVQSIPVISTASLMQSCGPAPVAQDGMEFPSVSYIQFSSGSTGTPRGIVLEWPAIQSNLRAITNRVPLSPQDHVISWLPMYHDMGLFGTLLSPLFAGCRLTLMDPSLFMTSPMLWFRVISDVKATITTTPPSALNFCLEILQRRRQKNLDLSSLSKVICGSELISPRLVSLFNEVLADYGVGETVLKPVYGLAEATLCVTMPPQESAPRLDVVDKLVMEKDRTAKAPKHHASVTEIHVSTGPVLEGTELQVLNDTGEQLAERHIGCIHVSTPSLLTGILEHGQIKLRENAWLDTGDLGYIADGELYITGRVKDVIIKNGRNYSAERIEHLACLAEGVQRVVAFGVYDDRRSTEQIVLLIEARSRDISSADKRDEMRISIRSLLRSAGYDVDEVHFMVKGSIPRTTSGKVRRRHSRLLYLDQKLRAAQVS